MIKSVKVLNTISMFVFVVILALVYAFLPISVELNVFEISNIHKQQFFFYAIVAFSFINAIVRVPLGYIFNAFSEELLAWLMSIVFVLNIYCTFLIGFLGIYNNADAVSPIKFQYLNYLGPLLILVWLGGLIFFLLRRRKLI